MLEHYLEQYVNNTLKKMEEYWESEKEDAEKELQKINYADTLGNPELAAQYRILEDEAITALARELVYKRVAKELTDLLERYEERRKFFEEEA